MIKYRFIFLFMILLFMLNNGDVKAGTYDDAYTFYKQYAYKNEPAYLNKNDGYIYFCSWGNKSASGIKYKTVGYTISVNISGDKDSVEVKLGGSIIREVSSVTKDNVVYVLRKARLSRIQELFNGNNNISWNQIFTKKNVFEFDAIMTVVENGNQLCGSVRESDNFRNLTADNNSYLFRKLSGIKAARKWSNPSDLNNFYNRVVDVESVSPLKLDKVYVSGQNVCEYNNVWYVKPNSVCALSMNAYFDDTEAASSRYHPNYNAYRISGWGDNQKYCVMQGKKNGEGKAKAVNDGTTNNRPLSLKGININQTTSANDSYVHFNSSANFVMKVPDGEKIYVVPEGRVYYNNMFPSDESNEKNLCDVKSYSAGKATIISDGTGPLIEVPEYLSGYENSYIKSAGIVSDNGSGINTVRLYRNDGILLYEKIFNDYCREYSIAKDYDICVKGNYTYYLYAKDNVGNETVSDSYFLNTNRAHNVQASISRGINGYNGGKIDVNVFGGNSEINALLIMSEDDMNPSGDRVIVTNKSVETHTLESGLYQYNYSVDAMNSVKDMPDGSYIFEVISGGRYVSSEPVSLSLRKDMTPPEIRVIELAKESCGWYKGKAVITMDVCDNYSGVNTIDTECNNEFLDGTVSYDDIYERYLKRYTVTEEGCNKLSCVATDKAGNESIENVYVNVDAKPPSYILYSGFVGTDIYEDRWINKEQFNGGIVLQDFQSGMLVAKSDIPIMIHTSGGWMEFNNQNYNILQDDYNRAEIIFTSKYKNSIKSGKYKYMLYVKDRVGNILSKILYVNVDCDAPYIEIYNNGWDKNKLKGTITVKDNHSGISDIKIKCNGNVTKHIQPERVNSLNVEIDLSSFKTSIKYALIEVEDAVGNSAEYPIEITVPLSARIHTRLR